MENGDIYYMEMDETEANEDPPILSESTLETSLPTLQLAHDSFDSSRTVFPLQIPLSSSFRLTDDRDRVGIHLSSSSGLTDVGIPLSSSPWLTDVGIHLSSSPGITDIGIHLSSSSGLTDEILGPIMIVNSPPLLLLCPSSASASYFLRLHLPPPPPPPPTTSTSTSYHLRLHLPPGPPSYPRPNRQPLHPHPLHDPAFRPFSSSAININVLAIFPSSTVTKINALIRVQTGGPYHLPPGLRQHSSSLLLVVPVHLPLSRANTRHPRHDRKSLCSVSSPLCYSTDIFH
ncbi:hypothetical protein BDD12DRAFT_890429 [Trichophaea hybrida]|nr:hypothetical protein BDD12DRAFT_890429 [Trichophaea hybrida]